MTDVAKIAASLSEAEIDAIRFPMEDNHHQWSGHISCWGSRDVAERLYALELTIAPKTLVPLTPLGLAVRDLLQVEREGE